MSSRSGFKLANPILCGLLALTLTAPAFAADPVPQSISLAEFSKDPKKVEELRNGIEKMRAAGKADPNSAEFRTSFTYWANTHGYFGSGKHATNLKDYIAYRMPQCLQVMTQAQCDTYYAHMANTPVPAGFTDDVWGTCQHSKPGEPNYNFLPWHRMYLHFFGRTLRKYVGDANFTLPYWNYFDNYVPGKKGLELPEIVRTSTGNSLYDQWRTLGLNQNQVVMDPTSASAAQAFKFDDFPNFSSTLQGQPHGAMHCAVGAGCTAPDIGFVPIAGLDPVFYLHHTNIDRLWQCWMVKKANGKTIDLAWAKANLGMPDSWYDTRYTFADENGNMATMTIADVFTPGKVDVNYDNVSNCDASPAGQQGRLLAAAEGGAPHSPLQTPAPFSSAKSVTLGSTPLDVSLKTDKARLAATAPLAKTNQVMQTYLTLENVQMKGSPALTYKIYLINKKAPAKSSYVATISFFGAGHQHDGESGHSGALGDLMYQVSSNLAEIGVTTASDAAVRFVPTSLLLGKNTIKQKPENGLIVGNIELETLAAPPAQK